MAWYLINEETKISKFKSVIVQFLTLFSLFVTPLILAFGDLVIESVETIIIFVWIVDISWAVQICFNFFTADRKNRTFRQIATNYLRFWFWIDAIATFPSIIAM